MEIEKNEGEKEPVKAGSELNDGLGAGRNLYTYVVEHEDDNDLRFRAEMTVNGGKLQAVAFYDALERLEIAEEALNAARLYILGESLPKKERALEMIEKALSV